MAWWLVYEELYGDMEKEYPIMSEDKHSKHYYDFDRNGPKSMGIGTDVVIFGGAAQDTINVNGALDLNPTISGSAGTDTISFTDTILGDDPYPAIGAFRGSAGPRLKGGMGDDHISLNPYPHSPFNKVQEPSINKIGDQKYEEDKSIKDLKDYVSSTYSGHYTTKGSNVQTLDLIESVGDAESFCRSNALKYLSRYDKKGQARRDILKAMHYCLLLYYFSGNTKNEITTRGYETF